MTAPLRHPSPAMAIDSCLVGTWEATSFTQASAHITGGVWDNCARLYNIDRPAAASTKDAKGVSAALD